MKHAILPRSLVLEDHSTYVVVLEVLEHHPGIIPGRAQQGASTSKPTGDSWNDPGVQHRPMKSMNHPGTNVYIDVDKPGFPKKTIDEKCWVFLHLCQRLHQATH